MLLDLVREFIKYINSHTYIKVYLYRKITEKGDNIWRSLFIYSSVLD